MGKKLTLEFVKEQLKKEGYTLLSDRYINANTKFRYVCPNGHEREMSWNKWQGGRRCPYCTENGRVRDRDIEYIRSEFEKEGYTLLSKEYIDCETKLDYICPNGHKYSTSWDSWSSKGNRCAICSNNVKLNIEFIRSEFEKEGYTLITKEYKNAYQYLEYICPEGHYGKIRWVQWYVGDNHGNRCLECSGKKRHSIDFIKAEFGKENYTVINEEYINGKQKLNFICPNGHEHSIAWNNWQQGQRCYKCNTNGTSKGEQSLLDSVRAASSELYFIERDRHLISPYELDILSENKKLAIEYCGLYWHSELAGKDKKYHLNKLDMCTKKGYNLITVFEDEWVNKREIVESRLLNLLGSKDLKTIYARKCVIKEITPSEARVFCEQNHLQGYTGSRIKLGAYYNGELVSVMTFAKPSISKGSNPNELGTWELSRFCSKLNYRVIGIASKLLKHFERNYDWNRIFSYADRRWSTGNVYEKIGFNLVGNTKPNYWYFKKANRVHRFSLRKKPEEPKNTTEWILRQAEGWNRIWDCGNLKYEIKKEN